MEQSGRWYLSFKLVFLLLGANDRLGDAEGQHSPVVQFRGIFEISLHEG